MPLTVATIAPIFMLIASNIFMTFAWYGHLKVEHRPLWLIVLVSWGIAFFEYCLAVPANRIGARSYSLAELKTLQEVMSLMAFVIVAWVLFDQRPGPSQVIGFVLIAAGAFVVFKSPFG